MAKKYIFPSYAQSILTQNRLCQRTGPKLCKTAVTAATIFRWSENLKFIYINALCKAKSNNT